MQCTKYTIGPKVILVLCKASWADSFVVIVITQGSAHATLCSTRTTLIGPPLTCSSRNLKIYETKIHVWNIIFVSLIILMNGSSHIWSVSIGVEYPNFWTLDVYLLVAILKSIKTNLQTCNLHTIQSVTQFLLNLPYPNIKT